MCPLQLGAAKRLKAPAFHLGRIHHPAYNSSFDQGPGEGSMFEQTLSGILRNLAIGLVLTAAVVGAGFALAFS